MLRYLRMAPWRRGPVLLLRRPGVLTALVAASFVAALPAAAAAPFVSSARNATLAHRVDDSCFDLVGPYVTTPTSVPSPVDLRNGVPPFGTQQVGQIVSDLRAQLGTQPGFAQPGVTLVTAPMKTLTPDPTPKSPAVIALLSRDGFEQHVTVLDGPQGDGVWIPDGWAAETHTKIGSTIGIPYLEQYDNGTNAHGVIRVRVAAVYRDLRSSPDQPWWCADKIVYRGPPGAQFTNETVAPLVLADQATVIRAATGQLGTFNTFPLSIIVSFPPADPHLSLESAESLMSRVDRLASYVKAQNDDMTVELGTFVTRAKFTGSATIPGIAPITLAGVLIGLLMVAAATVFWVLRRSRELTILASRGVGSAALGLKAVIEAFPALVVGAAAGWAAAVALVRTQGPVPLINSGAIRFAAYLTVASLVASIVVVWATAAARCRSLSDERRHRRVRILRLPWELLLLVGAPYVWQHMSGTTSITDPDGAGSVVHVPARLLVVPLMVIIGAAAFAGRLAATWLRRRTRRASPRSSALYIGLQRIAREAAIVVLLAGATAAPIALAAYGGTVTRSVKATVDAEAQLHVGSNVVINVAAGTRIPDSLASHATPVERVNGLIVGGVQTDLLAVDPATFARGAYWDTQINGESMDKIISALRGPGGTAPPFAAVASAGVPEGGQAVEVVTGKAVQYAVTDVPALPSAQGGYPVIVVPMASFHLTGPVVTHQIWIRGDPAEIRDELVKLNLPITRIASSDDLFVDTLYDPLTFTFEYLTALSLLGGLVTMVGLLLYLEARTPRHRRAYVMFRRMGLRPRTHRAALLIELGIPLVTGLVLGLALAAGLAKTLSGNFDVDVSLPPGTILSVPVLVLAVIAAFVVVIAATAASYAQLRIGRANPSEVLRDTI